MEPSEWFSDVRERYGWRDLIVGLLLSVLLSPLLVQLITPVYVGIGVYPSPEIDAEVEQIETQYREGMTVERFGNISWESDYEVYRAKFSHEGGPTMSQAIFEVRFPGCIKNIQVPGSNRGYGAITISNPLKPQIEATERPDSEILGCTTQITTENIHPNEGYTAEFVVEHTPSRCDLLTAYNPSHEFFVDYRWSQSGQEIDRRYIGEIQNAGDEFEDIRLPSNSTKLVEKEDYSAYIYGEGAGNTSEALETCFA